MLAGCATSTTLAPQELLPLTNEAEQYLETGRYDYSTTVSEYSGEYGCDLDYEAYRPEQSAVETMVLLAHGFMRDLGTMRGWAEHWASHGVPVTVMSLCNSTLLAGRHERNAVDMVALAGSLHDGAVIYAGFSAGGLAALLAAASDERTSGYLGLDSVDSGGLALDMGPTGDYPRLFLLAEPSACNANNNIVETAQRERAALTLRIPNSTHCHFEYPYDSRCELACGSVRPEEAQARIIDAVRSLATAWVLAVVEGSTSSLDLRPWQRWAEPVDAID